MRRIIRVGQPTHLKEGTKEHVSWTACGLIGTPSHGAAWDPRDVDCLNCIRTREYKERLGGYRHEDHSSAPSP